MLVLYKILQKTVVSSETLCTNLVCDPFSSIRSAKKRAEQLILELRGAAEDAAKATPGGPWEQTSTDLLARLLSHQGLSPGDSGV